MNTLPFLKSNYTLRCKKCGHERTTTQSWLQYVIDRYWLSKSKPAPKSLAELTPFLRCSKCDEKEVEVVQPKEKSSTTQKQVRPQNPGGPKWEFPKARKRSSSVAAINAISGTFHSDYLNKSTKHDKEKNSSEPKGPTGGGAWSKTSCHICGGDGGTGGRCFKCHGTGWI